MELFDVYPLFDINIVKGKGCKVWDDRGVQYLDFYGGHAVISVGHAEPRYVEAVSRQASQLAFYSNSVINSLQIELARKLGNASGYDNYNLFLVNSGAEANENALKLASFHTGKKRIISFEKAFHGRTSAAVDVTDNPNIKAPINVSGNVTTIPLNDITRLSMELSKGDVAAVIIEGIQGVGGIRMPGTDFMKKLRELTTRFNAVLILDEIQSGYGRTGKFFAHQWCGIRPDIITVAKGIANGFPMGGLLISPLFKAVKGQLGTTFGGNHLACAAACAVIDIIESDNLIANALRQGDKLLEALRKMDGIGDVRGKGLMIGFETEPDIPLLRKKLIYEHHIFTGASGKSTIRLLPPLVVTDQDVEEFLSNLRKCINNN